MDLMSDESGRGAGAGDGMGDTTRVGNAERDRAVALLGEHWRAGRLDPAEHELRVTRAKAAVTRADLDALFADLPEGPQAPAPEAATGRTPEPAGASETTGAVVPAASSGFMDGKRDTIMALTPFAALFLFFVTGSWLWFLAIPVMGILLYGPEGKKSRREGRKGQ
jgi:hypothetical protein